VCEWLGAQGGAAAVAVGTPCRAVHAAHLLMHACSLLLAVTTTHTPPRIQVVRTEGAAALWKGNLVTILHRLPYSSINFYTYENTTKLPRQQLPPGTSDFSRAWLSGAVAGLVACSAVSMSGARERGSWWCCRV
jgi:hypothetical protein